MDYLCCQLTTSDIISICDIAITSILGLWIAIGVQRSLTKNRYLREYFISELNNIRDEYKLFFNDIYEDKLNAKSIKDRLKVMSIRIVSFDNNIHQIYKLDACLLKDEHADIQQYITGEDEFNQQYANDTISFSSTVKSEILKRQSQLVNSITRRVIDINSAHRKFKWIWQK